MKTPKPRALAAGVVLLAMAASACSSDASKPDAGSVADAPANMFDVPVTVVDTQTGTAAEAHEHACPSTIQASWKVDGMPYASSRVVVLYIGTHSQIAMVECSDDSAKGALQIDLPGPIAVGSYPLSFTILHGQVSATEAGAYWSKTGTSGGDTTYFTTAAHTGVLDIASLDTATTTFSGTFAFSATNDAGTQVVQITDGVFTAAKYQLP